MTMRQSAYYDERAETMSRADLTRLQEALLKRMLRRSYADVPLIRQTWQKARLTPNDIQSLADFSEKAPFISKDSVRAFRDTHGDPFGGLKGVCAHELKGVTFTSGTSGDPTPVLRGETGIYEVCTIRDAWMIGARPGDYVTLIRPTFRVGHINSAWMEAGIKPILFRHHPAILPDLARAVDRFQPACHLYLSNPLLIALEEYFERTGGDPTGMFKGCKGATVGGEPLSPRLAALVRSWGLQLYELGGLGESSVMVTCFANDGMHAWEDHVLVECLDAHTDEPVADGSVGELVVTVLTDPFQPLVRYRTDDLVTLKRDVCGCGRTHARLKIIGRKSDQVVVAGRAILPRDLQTVIEADRPTRAGLYQIVRYAPQMESLRVRIGYEAQAHEGPVQNLADRLQEALAEALAVAVEVEMTLNENLLKLGPPHKIPRITNN